MSHHVTSDLTTNLFHTHIVHGAGIWIPTSALTKSPSHGYTWSIWNMILLWHQPSWMHRPSVRSLQSGQHYTFAWSVANTLVAPPGLTWPGKEHQNHHKIISKKTDVKWWFTAGPCLPKCQSRSPGIPCNKAHLWGRPRRPNQCRIPALKPDSNWEAKQNKLISD